MTVPTLQGDPLDFEDILERYRRDPKHGEQWVERRAAEIIERVRQACERKDYAALLAVASPRNPLTREVFTRITGLRLHRTQRESRKILEAFVGTENVAAYQQQRERDQQRRQQERQERAFDRLGRQLGTYQVRADGYGTLPVDLFIQRLIADGFTMVSERKRGVATEWFLKNAQGVGYTFRRRIEYEYIEGSLKRLQEAGVDQESPRTGS